MTLQTVMYLTQAANYLASFMEAPVGRTRSCCRTTRQSAVMSQSMSVMQPQGQSRNLDIASPTTASNRSFLERPNTVWFMAPASPMPIKLQQLPTQDTYRSRTKLESFLMRPTLTLQIMPLCHPWSLQSQRKNFVSHLVGEMMRCRLDNLSQTRCRMLSWLMVGLTRIFCSVLIEITYGKLHQRTPVFSMSN